MALIIHSDAETTGIDLRVSRRFPAPGSVRGLEQVFAMVDATGQAVGTRYGGDNHDRCRKT
jgi:hypothetical protein